MQKEGDIELEYDGDDEGKVMLTNMDKTFKGKCNVCGRKGHRKQKFP